LKFLLYYINKNYLSNLENTMNLFKSCVLSTSHEYVVRVTTIFQCLSLIELNAWEDEFFVVIEALQEG
jgi:hypothetical protein